MEMDSKVRGNGGMVGEVKWTCNQTTMPSRLYMWTEPYLFIAQRVFKCT